jgi:hypothetical protein
MSTSLRTGKHRLLFALAALLCAAGLSASAWFNAPNWSNADSLFYEAMSLEVAGTSAQAAQREVFDGPLARSAIKQEPSVAEPSWQAFERQFFHRRWLVPALAAAIRPLAGARALSDAAIIGYLLFGAALYLLLASRFAPLPSLATTVLMLALGPMKNWGTRPLTDGWGLALSLAAIGSALLVFTRGPRWLAAWIVTMLALSFTRDLALIPLCAVGWLVFAERGATRLRLGAILGASGVLATLPAYLIFGASLRLTLASVMAGFEIPTPAHSTWTYVANHYPHLFLQTVKADLHYMLFHPVLGLAVGIGLIALFALPARRGALWLAMRGATLGWLLVFALDPVYTGFRYELGLLAPAAVGVCGLVERVAVRHARELPGPAWVYHGLRAPQPHAHHPRPASQWAPEDEAIQGLQPAEHRLK